MVKQYTKVKTVYVTIIDGMIIHAAGCQLWSPNISVVESVTLRALWRNDLVFPIFVSGIPMAPLPAR